MGAMPEPPFPTGWWSVELGHYRQCDGTYELYAYESLPPLPPLDETYAWLTPLDDLTQGDMAQPNDQSRMTETLKSLEAQARELGLTLPRAFTHLLSNSQLYTNIPSATCCWFNLSARIVPCPGDEQAHVIGFMNDQQDCVIWYLYLSPDGGHRVLSGPEEMQTYLDLEEREGHVALSDFTGDIRVCTRSFIEFIYRYWLENTIYLKLAGFDSAPLTSAESAYIAHYAAQGAE